MQGVPTKRSVRFVLQLKLEFRLATLKVVTYSSTTFPPQPQNLKKKIPYQLQQKQAANFYYEKKSCLRSGIKIPKIVQKGIAGKAK